MDPIPRTVGSWLRMVHAGSIALPRFQRGEEWEPGNVEKLLTSVAQGLPIGAFLVLQVGDTVPFISRPLHTAAPGHERIIELLLDGQQRLTGLWRALHDNYSDTTVLVDLEKEDEEAVAVVAQRRWNHNGTRFPNWVDSPKQCWERLKFPILLLNPLLPDKVSDWARSAVDGSVEGAWALSDRIKEFKTNLDNFKVPALVLEPETPPYVAIKVFIQMNTNYVRLTAFDIVVAQVEQAIGESLAERVQALRREVPLLPELTDPGELVLSMLALLRDQPPNERGFLSLARIGFADFDEVWQRIRHGAAELVDFLQAETIVHSQVLPTETVLAPIATLWADAPKHSDAAGRFRTLMRRYLWHAFFSPRYDRSVPTRVLEDYRALRTVIRDSATPDQVPCFNEELPSKEDIALAPWPRRRHRLARAILCLTLRGGALDIADADRITPTNLRQREYHHTFPRAWLQDQGVEVEHADRAVNCIIISWKTNREVSAKEPLAYLRERVEGATLGEPEVRARLTTHGVDYDLLACNEFQRFLQQRADDCHQAMNALCRGEDWRP